MKKIYFLALFLVLIISMKAIDYTIPPNTYSIKAGDFDNDGDNDIVVGHIVIDSYTTLLENVNNGEFILFEFLQNNEHRMFFLMDKFDENDMVDFVIEDENGDLLIYYNSELSNPYIYPMYIEDGFNHISAGDFNADGYNDFVFSSYGPGQDNLWGIMYNLGNREFSEPQWFECPSQESNAGFYHLECKDLDNNGSDDIIAYTVMETYIYYDGNPDVPDSLNCYAPNGGLISEDFDNDSDYDIIVSHWPGGSQSHFMIYENLGDRQYTLHDTTFNSLWGQPETTDLNGDNLLDIVNIGNVIGIGTFYNNGNLLFDEATYQMIQSYGENYYRSAFADFDGNGSQDVAIIRYGISENNLTILFNDGQGYFLDEPQVGFNEECIVNDEKIKISNFPNPFNPTTSISFSIPSESMVDVSIYNVRGQKVKTILAENLTKGEHQAVWSGLDHSDKPVSSGVYFYKLSVNGKSESIKKCLLLK